MFERSPYSNGSAGRLLPGCHSLLQNPRWGGEYSPGPSPLPEDPFTDSAPQQRLPQSNINMPYTQGAYMLENQQIFALQEHCKALEQQILKLTTGCDTVKAMFQQLANAVSLPHTDPLKLEPASLIPLLATTTNSKTRPNSKSHPHRTTGGNLLKSKKGSDESDNENSNLHKGKKHRLSSSLVKPKVAEKRIKVDIRSPPLPISPPLNFITLPPLPVTTSTTYPPLSPSPQTPAPTESLNLQLPVVGASPSPLPPPMSPAKPCSVNNDKENIPPETSLAAPRPMKITINNPLVTLALAAAKVNLPAPLEPDPQDSSTASSADMGSTSALKAAA
ncbi:hypothetical protein P692DRAFT_20878970 [Suillus brevipes Sb2]|nr:hypothetical protein P692DRAFT_20878970 [Suillus brevipes Sb2]